MTPCRVTGLAVGVRRLTLGCNNYKTLNTGIVIKPGQTIRLHYVLEMVSVAMAAGHPIGFVWCMSVDYDNNKVFVAASDKIYAFNVDATSINQYAQYEAKGATLAMAVSARQNRLYRISQEGEKYYLVCSQLGTGLTIRVYTVPDSSRYVKLALSPDDNMLLAADSLGRRLLVMDSRLCTLVRTIPLSGHPSDVIFGRTSDQAYVTLCGSKRLARVDLVAGAEREWAATGNNPRGLFWSLDSSQLGCCNTTDKQLTLVNPANWSSAIVIGPEVTGVRFSAACWTDDPLYLLVLIEGSGVNGHDGEMDIAYAPNWFTTSKMSFYNKGRPIDIAWLPRLERYVALTRGGLWLVRGYFSDQK
jgi:WD40 repeat protein